LIYLTFTSLSLERHIVLLSGHHDAVSFSSFDLFSSVAVAESAQKDEEASSGSGVRRNEDDGIHISQARSNGAGSEQGVGLVFESISPLSRAVSGVEVVQESVFVVVALANRHLDLTQHWLLGVNSLEEVVTSVELEFLECVEVIGVSRVLVHCLLHLVHF